jgi:6-phosphogluconate dehydrogenase
MTSMNPMQLGMVGLGRMGANLTRRLMRDGHDVVVYDVSPDAVAQLTAEGATGTKSLDDFVAALTPPRAAWVMVPAGEITEQTVQALGQRFEPGDILIDGGNSSYRDDIRRAAELRKSGVHYVDVGTSGGVFGLDRGYCLMIGAEPQVFSHLEPLFATIAPGVDAAPRTVGRTGPPSAAEQGYLHCGPSSTASWRPTPRA